MPKTLVLCSTLVLIVCTSCVPPEGLQTPEIANIIELRFNATTSKVGEPIQVGTASASSKHPYLSLNTNPQAIVGPDSVTFQLMTKFGSYYHGSGDPLLDFEQNAAFFVGRRGTTQFFDPVPDEATSMIGFEVHWVPSADGSRFALEGFSSVSLFDNTASPATVVTRPLETLTGDMRHFREIASIPDVGWAVCSYDDLLGQTVIARLDQNLNLAGPVKSFDSPWIVALGVSEDGTIAVLGDPDSSDVQQFQLETLAADGAEEQVDGSLDLALAGADLSLARWAGDRFWLFSGHWVGNISVQGVHSAAVSVPFSLDYEEPYRLNGLPDGGFTLSGPYEMSREYGDEIFPPYPIYELYLARYDAQGQQLWERRWTPTKPTRFLAVGATDTEIAAVLAEREP